jgi:hypothetical protein
MGLAMALTQDTNKQKIEIAKKIELRNLGFQGRRPALRGNTRGGPPPPPQGSACACARLAAAALLRLAVEADSERSSPGREEGKEGQVKEARGPEEE